MVSKDVKLSLRTQCNLLEVHRSLFYKVPSSRKDDTVIANKLAEIYQKYPAYGYRRITTCLHRQGIAINRKCVLRLMRKMGLKAIYPGPRTTQSRKCTPFVRPNSSKNKRVFCCCCACGYCG